MTRRRPTLLAEGKRWIVNLSAQFTEPEMMQFRVMAARHKRSTAAEVALAMRCYMKVRRR